MVQFDSLARILVIAVGITSTQLIIGNITFIKKKRISSTAHRPELRAAEALSNSDRYAVLCDAVVVVAVLVPGGVHRLALSVAVCSAG